MGLTILFSHLKIILLQYFSIFSFNFQFSAVSKRILGNRCNTLHHEVNPSTMKAHFMHNFFQKTPTQSYQKPYLNQALKPFPQPGQFFFGLGDALFQRQSRHCQ